MANETDRRSNADDLNLTPEEATRLKDAFMDKEFVKLFQEYVEDVNSSESRKVYENEIVAMEKERGFDVKFVHPDPVYVMKFIINERKIFINICKNHFAHEPTSERKTSGSDWKIPVILSKPREDLDKKGAKCTVIDVMFHPQTIYLASQNSRFKTIVEETAVSMVREQFSINLSAKSGVYPKMKYKGKAPSVILRHNTKKDCICEPIQDYYKNLLSVNNPKSLEDKTSRTVSELKKPKYAIKYRDTLDLKDYSLMGYTDKVAPKEIVVEILLPEVHRAGDVVLDIFDRKLKFRSCPRMTHNYVLDLDLCYAIDKDSGTAKFDQTKNVLTVTLPVKERKIPLLEDDNGKDDDEIL